MQKEVFLVRRSGQYGARLLVRSSSGQVVTLARFERHGDAVSAARLFADALDDYPRCPSCRRFCVSCDRARG